MTISVIPNVGTDEQSQFKQNLAIQAAIRAISAQRETLTAARSYYVNASTGSNNSDGKTATTAWLTPQFAANYITQNIDLGGQAVTVNLTGAFTTGLNVTSPFVGAGSVLFDGGSSATCSISPSGGCVSGSNNAVFSVRNMTCGGVAAVQASSGARIDVSSVVSSSTVLDFSGVTGGVVTVGSYTSSANKVASLVGNSFGGVSLTSGSTVTLTGTPAFSSGFVIAALDSFIVASGISFSGGATGPRFQLGQNSVIQTGGSNPLTYFPGNAAGTNDGTGIYL